MNLTQARKKAKELGISHIKDRSLISLKLAIEDALRTDIDVDLIRTNLADKAYCDKLMNEILEQVSAQSGLDVNPYKTF